RGGIAQHPGDLRRLRRAGLPGLGGRGGSPIGFEADPGRRLRGGGVRMIPASAHIYWLVLPPGIAISVGYSAPRPEAWPRIWAHSLRLTLWMLGILVVATAVLLLINTQV